MFKIIFICLIPLVFAFGGEIKAEKEYYDDGNLWFEIPYNENGEIHGVAKVYDKNRKLKITIRFENDKAISAKCDNGKDLTTAQISD